MSDTKRGLRLKIVRVFIYLNCLLAYFTMLYQLLMLIVVIKPRKIKCIINRLINIIHGIMLLRQSLIYFLLLFVLF